MCVRPRRHPIRIARRAGGEGDVHRPEPVEEPGADRAFDTPSMGWPEVWDLAARQHGVVEVGQVRGCGVSPTTFRQRARREGWTTPYRSVVVLPGASATFEARVSAALLAVGGRVLAARRTAAYLHGIVDQPPATIEVIVPETRRAPRGVDFRTIRSRTLRRSDATRCRRLAVTTVARTILDLAAVSSVPELRGVIIDAIQRRKVRLDDLVAIVHRTRRPPGRGKLQRVLAELDPERCDSVFEQVARRRFRRLGLRPDPEPAEVEAGGRTVHIDIPWRRYRVGVECDGFGYHHTRRDLDRDNRRHNRLTVHTDWLILHLTWDRFDTDWPAFFGEVLTALRSRGAPV